MLLRILAWWRRVFRNGPTRVTAGVGYARIDRVDEAVAELRAALALEPRHFRANLLLGRILTLQGQAAAALPHLQTAAGVQPTDAEYIAFWPTPTKAGQRRRGGHGPAPGRGVRQEVSVF